MLELDGHAKFVIGLILLALVCFTTERIRLQATALLILVLLLIGFSVWPYVDVQNRTIDAAYLLSVFGNQGLVGVCALMVLGKGVETTRALQPVMAAISRHWNDRPQFTMFVVLIGAATMSAFLNNTPIVVVMLPVLIAIAQKHHTSPSKLLLPVGLATTIGGMATSVGTSTNLLVVDLAKTVAGLQINMFSFAPYVVVAGTVGLVYLWLVAPAITPHRGTSAAGNMDTRMYMATLVIDADSVLGKDAKMADFLARTHHELVVDRVRQGDSTFRRPLPTIPLNPGDQLFVRGSREALREAEVALKTRLRALEPEDLADPELEPMVMEILVTERSELDGRSFWRSDLNERFGIVPVALHRPDMIRERSSMDLNRIRLLPRDIVLCEGTREQFERLLAETRLLALTDPRELHQSQRAGRAVIIVASVIAVAALGIVPIAVSALVGVSLLIATKCIAWRHVGQSLSTQIVLVIVVSLALGEALMATGGDAYIASKLARVLDGWDSWLTIPALMLIMAAVTNVVTNNAAAVIGTPIGIQLAQQLGIAAEPMVLAVLFGANLSFATPIGYQTNLLVFSAGGYKFTDFVRVGLPLMLIMWAILSFMLVNAYGL